MNAIFLLAQKQLHYSVMTAHTKDAFPLQGFLLECLDILCVTSICYVVCIAFIFAASS